MSPPRSAPLPIRCRDLAPAVLLWRSAHPKSERVGVNQTLDNNPMTKLPDTFQSDGFTFRLIQRHANVALLEKTDPVHSRPSYEVVIIQRRWPSELFGANLPVCEAMPPSEAWGEQGWAYTDIESALRKFAQLLKERGRERPALGKHYPYGASGRVKDTKNEMRRLYADQSKAGDLAPPGSGE